MTGQQRTGMRQYIYRVACSMGVTDYIVIASNSDAALNEIMEFFRDDSNFKIQTIDKLVNYRIKETKE